MVVTRKPYKGLTLTCLVFLIMCNIYVSGYDRKTAEGALSCTRHPTCLLPNPGSAWPLPRWHICRPGGCGAAPHAAAHPTSPAPAGSLGAAERAGLASEEAEMKCGQALRQKRPQQAPAHIFVLFSELYLELLIPCEIASRWWIFVDVFFFEGVEVWYLWKIPNDNVTSIAETQPIVYAG